MSDEKRKQDEDNPGGYHELERVKDLAREAEWAWLQEEKTALDEQRQGVQVRARLGDDERRRILCDHRASHQQ